MTPTGVCKTGGAVIIGLAFVASFTAPYVALLSLVLGWSLIGLGLWIA